jgi:3',5'-cyclic-nucleotide phosphodiesterase
MEKEVGMETALIGGPPEPGNLLKLANGQIGFMSMFALPLFEGVSELLPQLASARERIKSNRSLWQDKADSVHREKAAQGMEYGLASNTAPPPSQPAAVDSEPARSNTATTQLHITPPLENHQENDVTALPVQIMLDQAPGESVERPSPELQQRSLENEFDFAAYSVGGTTLNSLDHSPQSPAEIKFDIQQTPETVLGIRCVSNSNRRSLCSVHGSLPSMSYGTGRDTRAQSASTGTNTMVTPLSPATNATSIAAGDSGDERDLFGSSVLDCAEDGDNSRPASSNPYTLNGSDHQYEPPRSNPTYPQLSHYIGDFGKGKGHRVMTTLLGNRTPSRASTPPDDDTPRSGNKGLPAPEAVYPSKSVSRRKSRLRLTFWRRRNSTSQ